MFKRITQKLKDINDIAEQRSIMLNAIRSCGIPISNKESTKKITELFVRLMEMKDKPHYDGVMEHLMERNLRDD